MLSNEFLKEAPARYDDMGQPIGAPAAPAQTPDWLKNAGKYISNKIGLKEPVDVSQPATDAERAAAASGYTGIDPIQRQRAGMAPATQQEINAYMKKNPAVVGGVTDRNGNPIASGGAQEVERAARAAAPSRKADYDVDAEAGEASKGQAHYGQGGTDPAAAVPAAAPAPDVEVRPVPASKIQATPLPAQKAFSEPADDAAAKAYAAADASRQPVKAAGENDEIEQMKKNAGLPKTEKAINPETGEEYDKLATDDGPEQLGLSPEQIAAANAPRTEKAINPETGEEYDKLATAQSANDGDAGEELAKIKANAGLAQSANDDKAGEAQAAAAAAPAAPVKAFAEPAAAAPAAAPAAPAHNPEADLDPAIMRARFDQEAAERAKPPAATPLPVRPGQQTSGTFGQAFKSARDQGLKTFSWQGKSYSTAMKGETPAAPAKSAPAPAAAKSAPAAAKSAPAPAAPAPAPAAKPLPAPQTGAAGQAARAASGQKSAPVLDRKSQSAVMESQEINRMRFLAGLSKD
jgi:hypothetical protein